MNALCIPQESVLSKYQLPQKIRETISYESMKKFTKLVQAVWLVMYRFGKGSRIAATSQCYSKASFSHAFRSDYGLTHSKQWEAANAYWHPFTSNQTFSNYLWMIGSECKLSAFSDNHPQVIRACLTTCESLSGPHCIKWGFPKAAVGMKPC